MEERPALGQQEKRVERRFTRPGGRQGAQGIPVIQVIDPKIAPDVLDDDELERPTVQRMKGVNDLDFPSRTFAPLCIPQLDPRVGSRALSNTCATTSGRVPASWTTLISTGWLRGGLTGSPISGSTAPRTSGQ